MRRVTAKILLICAPAGALLGWGILSPFIASKEAELRARHDSEIRAQDREWIKAGAQRKLAAHDFARRRERQRQGELEEALGGPTEAPARNPELSIRQMLEQIALACASSGATVAVRVNRFTDFEVYLELTRPLPATQLAEMSLCLLRHGAAYVHTVLFVHRGQVLAELDRRAIESVTDWPAASAAVVETLLVTPGSTTVAVSPAPSAPATEDDAELTGDARRLRAAGKAFDRTFQAHHQQLKSLLETQDRAGFLLDVRSTSDLRARMKHLDDQEPLLTGMRDFFLAQDQQYSQFLQAENFDPLVVKILARDFRERFAAEQPYVRRVFDALDIRQVAARALLADLERQWGNWSINAAAAQVEFTSKFARDAYDRTMGQFAAKTKAVSDAMKAWSDWHAAHKKAE